MSLRLKNRSSRSQPPAQDVEPTWKVIITTATEVNVWDGIDNKYDTVFTSDPQGIVAARLAKEGNVLAVAGNLVVVLHRIEQGQSNSYRLRGADSTRLLEYAADGKSLFLNIMLRNAIQTYSIKDDKFSEILKPHPSPVTTFATSFDSALVLSASKDPPTLHLDNLSLRTTYHLKPQASNQEAILASFHPMKKNIFLISFADGVLAAYDYAKATKTGQHIHAFGHLHDANMGGKGLTAAEFIPCPQARAVSVGEDGKCVVLDFEKKTVVGSFKIGAPATCLAIRSEDGKKGTKWLATIGTLHGWCYIYDQDGNRLHEVQVERDNRIREVRWKLGDVKLPVTATKTIRPHTSPRKISSLLPLPANRTPHQLKFKQTLLTANEEEPIVAAEKPEAPIEFPPSSPVTRVPPPNPNKPLPKAPHGAEKEDSWEDVEGTFKEQKPAWEDLQKGYTTDYMSIFSPVKNEPIKNSPRRRSARLSVRSVQHSPDKEQGDKIDKSIRQDEEGLLRPSVSSPTLAVAKSRSPGKKAAVPGETKSVQRAMAELSRQKGSRKEQVRREFDQEFKQQKLPPTTRPAPPATQAEEAKETKPAVPLKDEIRPEPPKGRDFAPPSTLPTGLPLPSTDSKAVEDFRKVRAKLESGHGHPVLSLFSSHLPNQKSKHDSSAPESVEGKENSASSKVDAKAERRRAKLEEKERRKSEKEEKKRKKKEGSFPPVSNLVFEDEDMEIDGPPYPDLPTLSPKVGGAKRKAADDPYEATREEASQNAPRLVSKGKGKQKSPIPEDIWMPEEVRKPHKRVNVGGSPPNMRSSGPAMLSTSTQNGTMSIHDMIADLKTSFNQEIVALKAEMKTKFKQQDEFLEGLIKGEKAEVKFLRDENERLRAQIREMTGK
ncbi:uncharacterized protein DFL_004599 [Arthrobotrys flagrans]|uniref:WD40 repeat-like protein n=1 Tax=Arthrobotrys flagrans TaxID=97331 RepID=A0A437A5J9_ARTFL|nr:hypothetical protein DFL_004599 [Arthrobotrys flagrans]